MRTPRATDGRLRPGAALSTLLTVLLLAATGALASQPVRADGAGQRPAEGGAPSATRMLRLAERYESAVREMLPLLQRQANSATLWTALYDARRSVVELDRILANAAIFSASNRDRAQLRERAARSHLRLALFETHGLEFERARDEIERARAMSDALRAPDFRIEWVAIQDGSPGRGLTSRYHTLTLTEFETALASIWSRARQVPLRFEGYSDAELLVSALARSPAPASGGLDARLLATAADIMREKIEAGRRAFELPLPPGVYRLRSADGRLDRSFIVPEASAVDQVVIDRARFVLQIDPKPGEHGPRFFLNGIEVTDFDSMPYGVYRVKVDENYFEGAPETVRFVMDQGIPDKSRIAWTLFIPAGGAAHLQFDRASLTRRLFRK